MSRQIDRSKKVFMMCAILVAIVGMPLLCCCGFGAFSQIFRPEAMAKIRRDREVREAEADEAELKAVAKKKAQEEAAISAEKERAEKAEIAEAKAQRRRIEAAARKKKAEEERAVASIKAKEAAAKSAKQREAAEKEAARQAAIEAARPRPTRENYNKIKNGMSLSQVQDILGPGKEVASGVGSQIVTWEDGGFLRRTIISVTFLDNAVQAKSILGP